MSSKDYRGFNDRVSGDVTKAALAAQSLTDTNTGGQKLRIRSSDFPNLIPVGSTIEFETISFQKLRFGDLIYVRFDKDLCIRRFLRVRMIRGGRTELHVTTEGPDNMVQILPSGALVGRLLRWEYKGLVYDPNKRQMGFLRPITDRLTDYGTTTPGDKFMAWWKRFTSTLRNKR